MDITIVRSMDKTVQAIALEASVLSNVTSTIKNFFPDLVHNLRASFVAASGMKKTEIKPSKLEKELVEFLKKHNYIELMHVPVTVPEGFDSDLLTATGVIANSVDVVLDIINKDINQFRVYVSTFITNKDTKISLKDMSGLYKQTKDKINAINTAFAGLYIDNSFETKKPFVILVKRNADIEHVFASSNKAKTSLNKIDVAALKQQLDDIASLLDTVISMVDKNHIENVSPEAIKNLAEGAKTMALAAETISAAYFRSLGILTCIDNLPEELSKNYK